MSNDVDNLEERIAAYIDGELPPAEAARLEVYLANTDAKLAEQVINMIGDRHRLRSLPKASAPDDLAARIMEQVERTSLLHNVDNLAPPRRPWWQSRAAVAASVLLLLGGFTYFMLHALRPANPAWQAAIDTSVNDRPSIAATPTPAAAPLPAPTTSISPSIGTLGQLAETNQMRAMKKDAIARDGIASAIPAVPPAPAAANAPLSVAVNGTLEKAAAMSRAATEPITLAFVARDPADFDRLKAAVDAVTPPAPAATVKALGQTLDDQSKAQLQQDAAASAAPTIRALRGQNPAPPSTQPGVSQDNLYNNTSALASGRQAQTPASAIPAATNFAAPTVPAAATLPVTYHVSLRAADIAALQRQFQSLPSATISDAPPTTIPAANTTDKSDASRIDCIITMAPPITTSQPTP